MSNRIRLAFYKLYLKVRKREQQRLNRGDDKAKLRNTIIVGVNSLDHALRVTLEDNMYKGQINSPLHRLLKSQGFHLKDWKEAKIPRSTCCHKRTQIIPDTPAP